MLDDFIAAGAGVISGVVATIAATIFRAKRNQEDIVEIKMQIREVDGKIDGLSLQVAKDYLTKNEVYSMHADLNSKLDRVIEELGKINVALVTKQDRN